MIDHVEHRALKSQRVQRQQTKHTEPEVTDRRVRDQFLYIRLHPANQGGIQNADDGKNAHEWRPLNNCGRHHRQYKSKQTIGAKFQEHACEQDRTGCRGFSMC